MADLLLAPVPTLQPATPSGEIAAAERGERLAERLLEDERLRDRLQDDEAQPLIEWAARRGTVLMQATASLPDSAAEAELDRVSGLLREMLRLVNLAIGERSDALPQLFAARLQALDTLLVPPLVEPAPSAEARAWLEDLLQPPAGELAQLSSPELCQRLCALLE
ncbi:MAG: hypothetical protein IT307_16490 [Chloroflexi bacterium]|nr:hypothetical protein [Chloroflexota bacterium]